MSIPDSFYIETNKYEDEMNKSTDWFIASWKLKNEHKQIALLNRKIHKKRAMRHLKKANEILRNNG